MIPWLDVDEAFPAVHTALHKPNGLLCAGADLSTARLINAYKHGIFPWFNPGDPILWWSPSPRMVLFPRELRISHSLIKVLRKGRFQVRLDTAFREVMNHCAAPRRTQAGTWITQDILDGYTAMHHLGYAHSVESWRDGCLVGGLYGIAMGKVFFGESMFSRESDASKVAFAHLVHYLQRNDFQLIDCQMSTSHLASLGAREISRTDFLNHLQCWIPAQPDAARWPEQGAADLFINTMG